MVNEAAKLQAERVCAAEEQGCKGRGEKPSLWAETAGGLLLSRATNPEYLRVALRKYFQPY